jgi:hypothetical protein
MLIALSLVASSAYSFSHHHGTAIGTDGKTLTHAPDTVAAPEIDPASGIAALTLLVGGLAVVTGKRRV